jgi:hypothetical protein
LEIGQIFANFFLPELLPLPKIIYIYRDESISKTPYQETLSQGQPLGSGRRECLNNSTHAIDANTGKMRVSIKMKGEYIGHG